MDRWAGPCALHTLYPQLFSIVYNSNILVSQVFQNGSFHIEFARQLVGNYHEEWCALNRQFQHFKLSDGNDQVGGGHHLANFLSILCIHG